MRDLQAVRFSNLLHGIAVDLDERFQRLRLFGPRSAFLALMTAWLTKQSLSCLVIHLHAEHRTPHEVAASTLCRAFAKLTDGHFQAVFDRLGIWSRSFHPRLRRRLHHLGLPGRMFAIDGTMLTTPAGPDTQQAFGTPRSGNRTGSAADCHFPQARLVVLYDIALQQPVAWQVGRCRGDGGESAAALALVEHLNPGDVVLLDRGFHSWALLQAIRARGAFFCLRACRGRNVWRCVRDFDRSALPHAYATIDKEVTPFPVRMVRTRPRFPKHANDDAIIITNLTVHPRRIGRIYGLRWAVEGFFRHLKIMGDVESFSGRSRQAVKRDIAIACIVFQLFALLELSASPLTACAIGDHCRLIPRTTLMCNLELLIRKLACSAEEHMEEMRRAAKSVRRLGLRAPKRRPGRTFPRICLSRVGRWRTPECLRR